MQTLFEIYSKRHQNKSNYLSEIETLLNKHRTIIHKKEDGQRLFLEAIKDADAKLVSLLLKEGVDCKTVDRFGDTALHLAAKNNHVDMVQLLLDHDADTRAKNNKHQTPLEEKNLFSSAGRMQASTEISALLLSAGADPQPLMRRPVSLLALSYAIQKSNTYQRNCSAYVRCALHLELLYKARHFLCLSHLIDQGFDPLKQCSINDGQAHSSLSIARGYQYKEYIILALVHAYRNKQTLGAENIAYIKQMKARNQESPLHFTDTLTRYLIAENIKTGIFKPLFEAAYGKKYYLKADFRVRAKHQAIITLLGYLSMVNTGYASQLLEIGSLLPTDSSQRAKKYTAYLITHPYIQKTLDSIYNEPDCVNSTITQEELYISIVNMFCRVQSPAIAAKYPDFSKPTHKGKHLISYLYQVEIPRIQQETKEEIPRLLSYYSL